jgi:hypothetical protein
MNTSVEVVLKRYYSREWKRKKREQMKNEDAINLILNEIEEKEKPKAVTARKRATPSVTAPVTAPETPKRKPKKEKKEKLVKEEKPKKVKSDEIVLILTKTLEKDAIISFE